MSEAADLEAEPGPSGCSVPCQPAFHPGSRRVRCLILSLLVASCAPRSSEPEPAFTVQEGRLFINGHEIEPPFGFRDDGDVFSVNGIAVWRRKPKPVESDTIAVPDWMSNLSRRQFALDQRVSSAIRGLQLQRVPEDRIKLRVAEIYRSSPLVDSVVVDVGSTRSIMIYWRPDDQGRGKFNEYKSWAPAPRRSDEPYDPRPLIRRIRHTLEEGGIVIVSEGTITRSPASRSESVLQEIAEARQAGPRPAGSPHLPNHAWWQFAHPDPLDSLEVSR